MNRAVELHDVDRLTRQPASTGAEIRMTV